MENETGLGIAMLLIFVIEMAVAIFIIASMWKVFEKAGQPGWAAIVPIYNIYVMLRVAGKPGWWLILFLVPFVSFIIAIIALIGLAENFGKSGGFAIGLILLPFIFFPILGFGDAQYTGEPII